MNIKNVLTLILFLLFLNCDNPIDVNQNNNSDITNLCNIVDLEQNCNDDSCQWIDSECVLIDPYLCIINYGGIIDDCGYCSAGVTGEIPNINKNICGECFADDPTDSAELVFYDYDNNKNTPDLFCGCSSLDSSVLNNGCCGFIGAENYFKDSNNNSCDPNNPESVNCYNTADRDDCGICEGDNSSCVDCLGNPYGTATIDDCGVCQGDSFFNEGLLSDGSCDCYGNFLDECGFCNGNGIIDGKCDCDGNILDCNGVCGGTAILDCQGVCSGSAIVDCNGICNGTELIVEGACDCSGSVLDECGVCNGNGIQDGNCDCNGNIFDCNSVCGGDSIIDCAGVCGGPSIEDECGICNGSGIDEGNCDCNDNVLDECGICGGGGYNSDGCCGNEILDCQLVCDGNAQIDDCGICNGQNINKDMCNICFGDNMECLQGILTLKDWFFDFKSIWLDQECSGPIHYDYYNYICVDEFCYDYRLIFNENFTFDFIIESWNPLDCNWLLDSENCLDVSSIFLSGTWFLNITQSTPLIINGNTLCLDYEPDNLEDFCFDNIDVLNDYQTCINNPESCLNNILYLSLSDENNCYQEQYSTENYIHSNYNNIDIEKSQLSIINKNIIKTLKNNLSQ